MSFTRDWGLFGSGLEGVGILGYQLLGCGGPAVRLPGFLPGDSSSFRCAHSRPSYSPSSIRGLALSTAGVDLCAK